MKHHLPAIEPIERHTHTVCYLLGAPCRNPPAVQPPSPCSAPPPPPPQRSHHTAMAAAPAPRELPWWGVFVCAGLGASTAELVTLPIDTAKVRLQLLNRAAAASLGAAAVSGGGVAPSAAAPGMASIMRGVVAEEGVAALYKGVWPALHRQLLFASLRVGLYGQVRRRAAGWCSVAVPRKSPVDRAAIPPPVVVAIPPPPPVRPTPDAQISAMFRQPGETRVSLSAKIMSGLVAGAIGITVATVRVGGWAGRGMVG